MEFDDVIEQVQQQLEQDKRIAYRMLKRRYQLDDEDIEDLKADLIDAKETAIDEDGKVLVWAGEKEEPAGSQPTETQAPNLQPRTPTRETPEAERRQLTVMFCDLVGSTGLSEQLDPEELREVVRSYQQTSATIIERFEGHIAQYLGDGLLVYFGYPVAHEDDAARAVRSGLEIITELQHCNVGAQHTAPLQVRIGIHTGPVVVGEMGGGNRQEQLALGETPNIAARIQSQANPDEVILSAHTYRLVAGLFEYEDRGQQELKGVSTPLRLYRVVKEGAARSRFEVAVSQGLTPLVGREPEIGFLTDRWERAKTGEGHVVLLSGEPGIGKSRLVQEMKTRAANDEAKHFEFLCSPYYQNSALHPLMDWTEQTLQFEKEDTPEAKRAKLQKRLAGYNFPQGDTLQLFASFLSLPDPQDAEPLNLSPQRQKQKTLEAFVAWFHEEAEQQPLYMVWEDLHWADPSTLDLLELVLEQSSSAKLLTLLTYRPEFSPPWAIRSHMTQFTLSRLGQAQIETMIGKVASSGDLSKEVIQEVVSKTDGVPLFVEELTKTVLESVQAQDAASPSSLAIPSTLQDSLMARLDRLGLGKEIAQLGATIGREFSYELLHTVSSRDEETLQQGLSQLTNAELVHQHGIPPQAQYIFKHALVQDTAYQSLLKSNRQQLHQKIAETLEGQFPETKEHQPELLAQHYTQAGLVEQSIPYWQQAGQRAVQASAHAEAIGHVTMALELLQTLPDTSARAEQELSLQITLGTTLMATKGWSAIEIEQAFVKARELCSQVGETPQLFSVLWGLLAYYLGKAHYTKALELAHQCVRIAEDTQDSAQLAVAHFSAGHTLGFMGEFAVAQQHFECNLTPHDVEWHRTLTFQYGQATGVMSLSRLALMLWYLGYPDQARQRGEEALTLAHAIALPFNTAGALGMNAELYLHARDWQNAQKYADAAIALCTEQGFPFLLAFGMISQSGVHLEKGHMDEATRQLQHGMDIYRTQGQAGDGRGFFRC